jgi:hypothetical protein
MQDDYLERHDDLNRSFRDGTIWSESDERLRTHIRTIAERGIPNQDLWPTEIVRGIAINHIQMARVIADLRTTMERLNRENGIVAKRVLILTWICAICAGVQAFGVFWVILHSR